MFFIHDFRRPTNLIGFVLNFANEICAYEKVTQVSKSIEIPFLWTWNDSPPISGCVKINIDGASKNNSEILGWRDLICNEDDAWFSGFIYSLGICSSFMAQLREETDYIAVECES